MILSTLLPAAANHCLSLNQHSNNNADKPCNPRFLHVANLPKVPAKTALINKNTVNKTKNQHINLNINLEWI